MTATVEWKGPVRMQCIANPEVTSDELSRGVVAELIFSVIHHFCVFFFFQAEDGIRDLTVTGVQTCALPILKQILGLAAGEGEATPPGDGRAAAAKSGGGDEFGEFLADVAVTVGKAVEAWRARVGEAVLRWEGEGYRTHRLEALLQRHAPGAVDQAITAFAE